MMLLSGGEESYDRAHAALWPELLAEMRTGGVETFVIYRAGLEVFAFQQRSTPFPGPDNKPSKIMESWWQAMQPLMETDCNGRPVREMLSEVFVLEHERTDT